MKLAIESIIGKQEQSAQFKLFLKSISEKPIIKCESDCCFYSFKATGLSISVQPNKDIDCVYLFSGLKKSALWRTGLTDAQTFFLMPCVLKTNGMM
jgi:hypothetical protein